MPLFYFVEDVVNKVREEFVGDNGPGESVLAQLQATWEMKLMQAGVILGSIDRAAAQQAAPGNISSSAGVFHLASPCTVDRVHDPYNNC